MTLSSRVARSGAWECRPDTIAKLIAVATPQALQARSNHLCHLRQHHAWRCPWRLYPQDPLRRYQAPRSGQDRRPPAQASPDFRAADAMPPRYALLVLLGAGTGLRQGEAFGLALDRVHTTTKMITVDQQVIIVNRHPVLGPPKTSASLRDVPMPQFVQDHIQKHAEQYGLNAGDVLCRTPRGTLLRRDYYNHNFWKPAIAAAGLPDDTTFHDLAAHLRQHRAGRGSAYLRGLPVARPQVDHGHRGPVWPPGPRGQRPGA